MSPTSLGRVAAMFRFFGSVSNLPLLTIGDYYYHSHDKMVKGNGDRAGIGTGIGGYNRLSHGQRGITWLHCFPCPCRLKTVHCYEW